MTMFARSSHCSDRCMLRALHGDKSAALVYTLVRVRRPLKGKITHGIHITLIRYCCFGRSRRARTCLHLVLLHVERTGCPPGS